MPLVNRGSEGAGLNPVEQFHILPRQSSINSMRKILLFSAISILACGLASADDQVRSAQESLKAQGFYTGPADGEMNAATGKAIRRFQIRNGIDATGELDPATLNALKQNAAATAPAAPAPETEVPEPVAPPTPEPPAPPPAAPRHPAEPEQNDLRRQPAPPAAPRPPEPPEAGPANPRSDAGFARLYERTPFSNAPRVVQIDTLRKAQALLARAGIYDAPIDGQPSPDVEEAIIRYQSHYNLPRTGRLDIDTLAQMHLLPVSRVPLKPFRGGPLGPPPHAMRGEEPAVRGIPAD